MLKDSWIKAKLSDGSSAQCRIEYSTELPYTLLVSGLGYERYQISGRDHFDSLVILRRELEERGIQLLCAGACPNVQPSGMSRSMGGGTVAYRLIIGRPALREDLVEIFDEVEAEAVGTIEQQELYLRQWGESLK